MTEKIQEISMSNTKKEILEAYNNLIKLYEEKEKQILSPEKQMAEKKETETIQLADELVDKGLQDGISLLKTEINKTLTQLSENLDSETQKYSQIKAAIESKEKELQELYDIEKSAHSLAALVNAHHEKKLQYEEEQRIAKETFNAESNEEREKFETEMYEKREQWKKEQEEHKEQIKLQKEEEKRQREREKEEYEYTFNREKQLTLDAFNDEKEKLTKEIATKKEAYEKEFAERKTSLDERERIITEREKHVNQLQKQVDEFPKQLETTVQKAIKETTEKLTAEKQAAIELLTKEFEGKINVYESRIEALEKTVKEQKNNTDNLSQQLANAYEKVQGIALKTVEGASGSKVIADIQKLFTENQRKEKE